LAEVTIAQHGVGDMVQRCRDKSITSTKLLYSGPGYYLDGCGQVNHLRTKPAS